MIESVVVIDKRDLKWFRIRSHKKHVNLVNSKIVFTRMNCKAVAQCTW